MTIKVHQLAKELNINSKDLMEKMEPLGISVKSHMSVLDDAQAQKIKASMSDNKSTTAPKKETKIVSVETRKSTVQEEEPKVVVKAAKILPPQGRGAKPPIGRPIVSKEIEGRPMPPTGRPVTSRDLEGRPMPPTGKPVVSKDLDARTAPVGEKAAEPKDQEINKPIFNETKETVDLKQKTEEKVIEAPRAAPAKEKPVAEVEVAEKKADTKEVSREAKPTPTADGGRPQGSYDRNRQQGDRPQGSYDRNRPQGDRPQGSYDRNRQQGDRPQGSYDRNRPQGDRPQGGYDRNRQQGDRPQGSYDRNRQQGDRPQGSYDRNRQQGDRPQGSYDRNRQQGDRPQGSYDRNRPQGDRPQGSYDRNRPQGDRPQGSYDRNRPQGDRPQGGYDRNRPQGDRPQGGYDRNRQQGDRPQGGYDRNRSQGDRPSRIDKPDTGLVSSGTKPHAKKPVDKKKTEKEKSKFAKLEGGAPAKKTGYGERSLEKTPKPKKHIKKEKQVEEPTINVEELPEGTVVITVPITVAGFCEQLRISTSSVIMKLMKLGIMANINQNLDEETVMILADEMGVSVAVGKVQEEVVEKGLELFDDKEEDLKPRPPIITVMGHVDHGKTSLLDAIRKTNVTASESGGITQHIGASEVRINGQKIVFLDTPGHEAFTAMRARGAHITDIAVLVVAADDSVKPQTIESISHTKAAGVPVIVAINKMDKPGANIEKVKQDLTEHNILVEDWGGDTICVPVSAKTGEGIVNLLEMILLQAEVLELKANPNRLASGTVVEARLDKAKGPVATLLVLNGTLQSGMSIVAGTCSGRIRLMTNYKGETIKKAGPATAVEILGLTDVPQAGDEFNAVREDKDAREIAENRKMKQREEVLARNASTTLEALFSQIQEGEVKELNLIIKGDVQGSVGALVASLEKLKNENVRVKIIHTGVGTVTESDIMLAGTSGAVIIGFNIRPTTAVATMAERENVEIRTYRVIYNVIDDVEAAMKGMLDPEYKEVVLGRVVIRNTFKVPGVGIIGGAYVEDGKVVRNAQVRLVRDGIVIHEGKISSLKRFKDDAKEVLQGFECGIGIEKYNDIKEDDIIECFEMQEIERK